MSQTQISNPHNVPFEVFRSDPLHYEPTERVPSGNFTLKLPSPFYIRCILPAGQAEEASHFIFATSAGERNVVLNRYGPTKYSCFFNFNSTVFSDLEEEFKGDKKEKWSQVLHPLNRDIKKVITRGAFASLGAATAFGACAPLMTVASIQALGFTAGGIAAGSAAAGMMSAAALANGGAITSGSTVAILQSIGASGLSTGATAGVAMGAFLGAAVIGGMAVGGVLLYDSLKYNHGCWDFCRYHGTRKETMFYQLNEMFKQGIEVPQNIVQMRDDTQFLINVLGNYQRHVISQKLGDLDHSVQDVFPESFDLYIGAYESERKKTVQNRSLSNLKKCLQSDVTAYTSWLDIYMKTGDPHSLYLVRNGVAGFLFKMVETLLEIKKISKEYVKDSFLETLTDFGNVWGQSTFLDNPDMDCSTRLLSSWFTEKTGRRNPATLN